MSDGWETLDGGEPQTAHTNHPVVYPPCGLREAREATGLHIPALAAALKVPVKKLDALESGRYEELPDLTFARALASSACRHLKIDPAGVLELIPQAHAPTLGGTSASVNAPFRPDPGPASSTNAMGWFKRPYVWASAIIVLAAGALALVPDWKDWPGKDFVGQVTSWFDNVSSPSSGMTRTEVVVPVAAQPDPTPAVEPVEAIATAPAEENPPPLKSEVALTQETEVPTSSSLLHLEATDDSWVEVIDGAGKLQVQRVMKRGDVLDFSASPPYSVVLGRADAVTVQVRGKLFDVAPYARNSVARFKVK